MNILLYRVLLFQFRAVLDISLAHNATGMPLILIYQIRTASHTPNYQRNFHIITVNVKVLAWIDWKRLIKVARYHIVIHRYTYIRPPKPEISSAESELASDTQDLSKKSTGTSMVATFKLNRWTSNSSSGRRSTVDRSMTRRSSTILGGLHIIVPLASAWLESGLIQSIHHSLTTVISLITMI